ncbi:nectin cell adhesion molecule 1b [Electrophorus electricus]|uniref:nectin cell adhesion molecule 1b n=1 Tax=Electrophorus electricus TaxID=8005 RepID=UPI000F0A960F|nr:nectin cell adhesion molecule 1b [Electrophorus electricus]
MAMLASCWILLLMLMNASKGTGQSVQMDMVKSGFVGSTVELRCLFINSKPPVKISQVTWQKFYNGTKQNVAIANPALGVSVLPPFKDRVSFKHPVRQTTPSLEDTTIIFNGLLLSDEAAYICEYTTFPAGNRENMVNLTVYARPQSQMTLTMPTIIAQKHDKMRVATCLSANGKPPSDIKWETQLKGEPTFQESRNPNGTVTVRSDYILVPSRETHGQKLTCVVTYQTERFADTVMLNVQYEPDVKIKGFDGNWYLNRQDVKLTCEADANPAVTVYQWKLLNGSLPKNVEIRNNTLIFRGPVTHELGGTYVCDATNSIGTRSGLVEVNVTEFPIHPSTGPKMSQEQQSSGAAIWGAVGGVALLVGGAVLLFFFLRRRQRTFKGDYSTKKHVFGNGYSKAGGLPAHPPMPKNLQYPDDSDDEKKPTQIGAPGGFDGVERDFDGNSEDLKRPYFTVDEGESRDYDERTLAFQYDPESEINDDMVSQTDGSVISKKEWYV